MTAHRAPAPSRSAFRPATDPGEPDPAAATAELVVRQVRRTVVRALASRLEPQWSLAALEASQQRLAQIAAKQQLQVLERPLCTLDANPAVDPRERWSWRLLLPFRGQVAAEALPEEVTLARTDGGTFVEATTTAGLEGLDRLYALLFQHYLPRYQHRLTRPRIYHRVALGAAGRDATRLTISVLAPVVLTLELGELGPAASAPSG